MKVYIGITAALALAFASLTTADAAQEEYLKIPIKTVNGPIRLSTMGRWRHTLHKYGLLDKKSAAVSGIGTEAAAGPRGHQRSRALSETNVARIPLVDYDFDREIDFDTGSSQFIIAAKGCAQCSGTTHYDPTISKTFRANGKPWRITYGDQSHAAGYLGWDHITIDGIRVKDQQLALVTNESAGFDDTIDGIMGLAFGALSASIASTKTVFENMMAQKLVDQGVFSFYLGKSSLQGGGEFIFGGMDLDRVAPGKELTYTPVTRARYWQIKINNVFVNGKSVVSNGGGSGGGGGGGGKKHVFIKNNYVVFDQANKRVGIAPLKLEVDPAPDSDEKLDIGINSLLEANEFSLDHGLEEEDIRDNDEPDEDGEGLEGRDKVGGDDGEGHIEAQEKRWEITDETSRDHVGSVAKYSQVRTSSYFMKFGLNISAALALVFAGVTIAAPANPQGKTIRIPIVNKGPKYQPNTIAEWSYTLRKFGFEHAAEGMTAQAVADLALVDLGLDREYYGLIDIGTPAQTLKVMMDTGSARLLISSSKCPDCTGNTHFDRSASSTYQPSDEIWSANFGDMSSASGVTGHDVVKLADLTIKDQPVHLAEQMSPDFDGDTTSVLESMMDQDLLDKGLVSFALGKYSFETGGEALFGGIDMSKVEDGHEITYTDVVNDRYWAVRIADTFVDGQSVFSDSSSSKALMSVMDTGSTLLILPAAVASAIHKKIPKAIRLHERWYVPCKGTARLEFEMGGAKFGVPYSDIARERSALRGMCHSGVQTNPGNFAIIGDVFLKNNYVVFDEENRRIGFAPLKQ
ncbi:hypothetical protein BGZ70_008880 [Mortierella alpina]|uniref:Peptidase A1 domain-containing protein n=1 Tax=Mortierella alpina TaxID=64518 RepID=A0A9P6M1B1_MORAP|nr:hypothetical protein BGZ70_008880 [Mortierella alpina]